MKSWAGRLLRKVKHPHQYLPSRRETEQVTRHQRQHRHLHSRFLRTHPQIKETDKTTTLTRRATCGGIQFSETDRGRLETEDRIDVLEESGSNEQLGPPVAFVPGPKPKKPPR